ncbi:cytochrome c family protein [uncultured Roseobacter sp.]|uniref:c-type cytochrome n=1 Tax=uncultured Roseobacter sp. TaxID=114847 RepID=UPI0026031BBF|nr:cytochrome c family protein [uncultured Roseobacter sp.]
MVKTFLAALSLTMLPAMAFADGHVTGDAAAGEKVFRKCKACHAVGEGAENKVGPVLNGVVDRAFGAVEGFSYSDVLMEMAAEGKTWTPEELDAFLQKPRSYLKGTKMSFAGLRKEEDRANVIAYLASFPAEGS